MPVMCTNTSEFLHFIRTILFKIQLKVNLPWYYHGIGCLKNAIYKFTLKRMCEIRKMQMKDWL